LNQTSCAFSTPSTTALTAARILSPQSLSALLKAVEKEVGAGEESRQN